MANAVRNRQSMLLWTNAVRASLGRAGVLGAGRLLTAACFKTKKARPRTSNTTAAFPRLKSCLHYEHSPIRMERENGVARSNIAFVSRVANRMGRAAESLKKLSAREINTRLSGRVVTDEAHWSDSFLPDGTLEGLELGQLRLGTWVVKNGELCLTRKSRKQTLTECFEVWQWQDHIEYRRDGVTIMKAVLRRK
jgi:hypothetical protein